MSRPVHGLVIVDKPPGMTSAAVVARVKRATGARKVGHTGTLDPMATGVLPLCLGEATKLAGYLLADDKAYDGELELGAETDTLDAEGRIVRERRDQAARVDEATLTAAMRDLEGEGTQRPPMYSAVRQDGRRLHELARAGLEVERPPRPVRIERLALTGFAPPRARFSVACSKGTYVRTLVADLGEGLGCGAHLTALRRTRSGRFTLAGARSLEAVEAGDLGLLDPAEALDHLPRATVPAASVRPVRDGKHLEWEQISPDPAPAGLCRLLTPEGALLALAEVEGGRLRYARVFTYGLT